MHLVSPIRASDMEVSSNRSRPAGGSQKSKLKVEPGKYFIDADAAGKKKSKRRIWTDNLDCHLLASIRKHSRIITGKDPVHNFKLIEEELVICSDNITSSQASARFHGNWRPHLRCNEEFKKLFYGCEPMIIRVGSSVKAFPDFTSGAKYNVTILRCGGTKSGTVPAARSSIRMPMQNLTNSHDRRPLVKGQDLDLKNLFVLAAAAEIVGSRE